MDLGAVIQLTLAILGGASIAGGIVAYRGSERRAVRTLAAAAVAARAVMMVVVGLTVSVSSTSGAPPDPVLEGVEASAQLDQ